MLKKTASWGNLTKEYARGGTCSTHGRDEKCVRCFGQT